MHPNYDDYWKDEDCSLHFAKMNVPCFTIGSWYDFMNQGSIASFQGRQHHGGDNSRGKQQLIIGPWLHGRLNKGFKVAELTYPEDAAWPDFKDFKSHEKHRLLHSLGNLAAVSAAPVADDRRRRRRKCRDSRSWLLVLC